MKICGDVTRVTDEWGRKKSCARNVERSVPKNFPESAEAIAIGSAEGKLPEKNAGMNQDATN
jgi:hypothetical protein